MDAIKTSFIIPALDGAWILTLDMAGWERCQGNGSFNGLDIQVNWLFTSPPSFLIFLDSKGGLGDQIFRQKKILSWYSTKIWDIQGQQNAEGAITVSMTEDQYVIFQANQAGIYTAGIFINSFSRNWSYQILFKIFQARWCFLFSCWKLEKA